MRMRAWLAALLLMGSFFCMGAVGRVPVGVTVDGIDVGGLSFAAAERRVCARPFIISTPLGEMDVGEELSCPDGLARLLRHARKGERLHSPCGRVWVDMEERLLQICEQCAREPEDALLLFGAEGFEYVPAREGFACDHARLRREVTQALARGEERVALTGKSLPPAVTEAQLRARTCELSRCSTRFDAGNAARRHNLALAAAHIFGSTIPPHGSFSFNAAVGRRTAANGYCSAPVIVNGAFQNGVGGGVCQVSTTLFCAALQAGLGVTESHPHSLAVGYTAPSLDAMVSETSDLKLYNPHDTPVYVLGAVGQGTLTVALYGLPDGFRYQAESVVLERIAPPPPRVLQEGEQTPLRREREGLRSESYLNKFDGSGRLISRKRIRCDRYAAVQGVISAPESAQNQEKN